MFEWVFAKDHTDDPPLTEPLTPQQMMDRCDSENTVKGTVVLDPGVLGYDLEEKLDAIAEALTGSSLLMDINYEIVGLSSKDSSLLVEVSGDVSEIAESDEWEGWNEPEDDEVP